MEPEIVAVIASISVIGGIIVTALIAACIISCVAGNKLNKTFATPKRYGAAVAQPSFVRYPEPAPAAAPHIHEDDPWLAQGYDNNPAVLQEYPPPVEDIQDPPMFLGPPAHQEIPRQSLPEISQSPLYRSSSVQNLPRRSSYVQDLPRRPSYAQGLPRARHSYAPNITRRPSNVQGFQRRPHSYNPPTQGGQQNKLWYNYLKEDPNYFTQDGLEWNRRQPRVWSDGRGGNIPAPAPHHSPPQHYDNHQAAAARLNWI